RLMGSLKKLRDFVTEKLHPFHGRVAEMAETDPSGALALYSRNFPEVRDSGEKLFRDLTEQVAKVKDDDATRAQWIALWGLLCIPAVLIASIGVGLVQSSSVTKPLNRLVATIDRMRRADFSER